MDILSTTRQSERGGVARLKSYISRVREEAYLAVLISRRSQVRILHLQPVRLRIYNSTNFYEKENPSKVDESQKLFIGFLFFVS